MIYYLFYTSLIWFANILINVFASRVTSEIDYNLIVLGIKFY